MGQFCTFVVHSCNTVKTVKKKYCRTLRDTLSEPFWKPGLAALPCVTHHIHSDIQIEVRRTLRKPHTQYMGTLRQAFGKKVSFRCIWIHLILVFLEDSVALLCPAFASPGQITAWQSLPKHGKAKVEAIG